MALSIPEVQILKIVSYLLTHIRTDYNEKVQANEESDSIIYKMWNGVAYNSFNYYEQAKEVLLRADNDPRRITARIFYDPSKAGFPSIHIVMPGESLDQDYLGHGDETEEYVQLYKSRYSIIITSSNFAEVLIIYYTLRSILIAGVSTLAQYGILLPKSNGGDLTLNEELAPRGVFYRAIFLDCTYQEDMPAIEVLPDIQTMDFSGTTVIFDPIPDPTPIPVPGFKHNDLTFRDEDNAHPASSISDELGVRTVQDVIDEHDLHIIAKNNPHEVTKEQVLGLKSTDSPEFADIQTPALQSDAVTGGEIPSTIYDWFKSVYTTLVNSSVKSWITGLVTFVKSLAERVGLLEDNLILELTVTEDTYLVEITQDKNGNPLNLTGKYKVTIIGKGSVVAAGVCTIGINGITSNSYYSSYQSAGYNGINFRGGTKSIYFDFALTIAGGGIAWNGTSYGVNANLSQASSLINGYSLDDVTINSITKLSIKFQNGSAVISNGTKINITRF